MAPIVTARALKVGAIVSANQTGAYEMSRLDKWPSILIGCCVAVVISTIATCAQADSWTSQDKAQHVAMSASLAKLTTSTHGRVQGAALAMIPGALKEVSDLSGSGTPSVKDMAANLVGVAVGVLLPRQYMIVPIAPRGVVEGVRIAYVMEI